MKILYFTNKPAPYRVEFFNRLNKKADLTVLFDYNSYDHRNPKWYSENKYNFKYIYIKKFGFFQLRKILKEKFDIIVIGTYATTNAAILNLLLHYKKIDFFINADGGFIDYKEKFISKFVKKFFISKASYYLSSGKETNKYLEYYGAKKENIFIYPFTSLTSNDFVKFPIDYKKKVSLRTKAGYNYRRLFVSVGSFIDIKGYDFFLEAIKDISMDDIGFVIIGGGKDKEKYMDYIVKNKINNFQLVDFCSKKDILNFYKMSDVFFFNSKGDVWGLVINEAMASGLPVISSKTTIASLELLDEKNLYDYYDFDKIKEMVYEYYNKTENQLYKEGLNNLLKIKDYTIENMTKRHLEIFENVLSQNKKN